MTYLPAWLGWIVILAVAGTAVVLAIRRGGRAARWLAVLAVPTAAILGASAEEFFCETRWGFSGCEHYSAAGEALMWLAVASWPVMLLASLILSIVRPARKRSRSPEQVAPADGLPPEALR